MGEYPNYLLLLLEKGEECRRRQSYEMDKGIKEWR
jgi:hypothetical protein